MILVQFWSVLVDFRWVWGGFEASEANCIGLVKLMGRHCGFIAMNAALAARDVDICPWT